MDTPLDTLAEANQERISELTGGTVSTLEGALDQWEREHELVGDIYAHLDLYQIHRARLIKLARLANIAIERLYNDAGLFLSDKTRQRHQDWTDELEKINQLIPQILDPNAISEPAQE